MKGNTNELYKLQFSDAKAKYFEYKKHYMSIKDMVSYSEIRNLKGIFKDLWSLSAVIGSIKWEVSIVPIESD